MGKFEAGNNGKPVGARAQCTEIKTRVRNNAIVYASKQIEEIEQMEELLYKSTEITDDRRLCHMEKIMELKLKVIAMSMPQEQKISVDDDSGVKNARMLLMQRSQVMIVK